MGNNILEMRNICKSFPGVIALYNVNFSLRKGEAHALLGENGAGKSTLMKILTGIYTKDAGSISICGKDIEIHSAEEAQKSGIAMIYQEFSLIPTMTVSENIFLKSEAKKWGLFIDDTTNIKKAKDLLTSLNVKIDPKVLVNTLGVGDVQIIEIVKALSKKAEILIMDEPTSSLSESETKLLFKMVRQLKGNGISIVYISHRMEEVFEICDRVTVLRDGKNIITSECSKISMKEIITHMLGVSATKLLKKVERHYTKPKTPVLCVKNLSYQNKVYEVSFDLYPGEILGLAGLLGSGRTEIAETIFGIRKPKKGEIFVDGKAVKDKADAMKKGIALVSEDRRTEGLILQHSIKENFMLPNLKQLTKGIFINDKQGSAITKEYVKKLAIKIVGINQLTKFLSGGNQQKVVLGKWLARKPRILILDEPTIGVDVGVKAEIMQIIRELANSGIAVLLISSELIEILSVCDRILVIYKGKIKTELKGSEIESEEVLHRAIQGI